MTEERKRPVAVVTGGRQGLGRGAALALAAAGFDLVIVDLVTDETLFTTLREVEALGVAAKSVCGDISDLGRQNELVDGVWSAFGGVDCLVNNAGVPARPLRDLLELTVEGFDRNFGVNLRGTFFLTQRLARRMIDAGPSPFHRSIIVVTSIAAGIVSTRRGEYCMSKAGLSMMTRLFAARLAGDGILVHEIRPGLMRTEMTAGAASETGKLIEAGLTPIRRWGEAEDVGSTVAALATGAFPFTTGQPIFVDGGLHVHRID